MCTLLLAYEAHPDYRLVLAANRDEYYGRPTARAGFWEDAPEVLAGRDLGQGGTWLGVTRSGRLAAVTNFRDPSAKKEAAPSRGKLVSDFLRLRESSAEYLEKLRADAALYNGFNLVVGDGRGLSYFSNTTNEARALTPGVYGLSNHLLDTPWPKVEQGKRALEEILRGRERNLIEGVFAVLADRAAADDRHLPDTGVGLEIERMLSPLFITSPVYGTRASTVVLIDRREKVTFVERSFGADTAGGSESAFEFRIDARINPRVT
ncbi:MAG: NRDE family protein [Pyrinomonadaceae bacterium]